MWVGGYSDWTPAEKREWDRDLEELEADREERDLTDTSSITPTSKIEKGKD